MRVAAGLYGAIEMPSSGYRQVERRFGIVIDRIHPAGEGAGIDDGAAIAGIEADTFAINVTVVRHAVRAAGPIVLRQADAFVSARDRAEIREGCLVTDIGTNDDAGDSATDLP